MAPPVRVKFVKLVEAKAADKWVVFLYLKCYYMKSMFGKHYYDHIV